MSRIALEVMSERRLASYEQKSRCVLVLRRDLVGAVTVPHGCNGIGMIACGTIASVKGCS